MPTEQHETQAPSVDGARVHELKCDPAMFDALLDGRKPFEVRVNDRDFAVGDSLWLREYLRGDDHPVLPLPGEYTGRECRRVVTFVLPGGTYGLPDNLCVLGLRHDAPSADAALLDALDRMVSRAVADGRTPDSLVALGAATRLRALAGEVEGLQRALADAARELPTVAGPVANRIRVARQEWSDALAVERARAERAVAALRVVAAKADGVANEAASYGGQDSFAIELADLARAALAAAEGRADG